jgi:hypothetical protein
MINLFKYSFDGKSIVTKPTQTTNRLHFSDLHHSRFEILVMIMLHEMHNWKDLHHDGQAGGDDGVDIRVEEKIDDGSIRHWYIQCRNYQRASKSVLTKAVDDTLEKSDDPPDVLLVVIGCDVTLKARKGYEIYARDKGIADARLWTASNLETMLYNDRQDLLAVFFGYSLQEAKKLKDRKETLQERADRRKEELRNEKERKAFIFSTEGYHAALKELDYLFDQIKKLTKINRDPESGLGFNVVRDSGGKLIEVHSQCYLLVISMFLPSGNPGSGTNLHIYLIEKVSNLDLQPNKKEETIKKQLYLFNRNESGHFGWSQCILHQGIESENTGKFFTTTELAEKEIDDLADRVTKFIKKKN